jgi:hypothetical protein
MNTPMHTGFFFQFWDQLAGSLFPGTKDKATCPCAKCCRTRGERTQEQFAAVHKPDYCVLLRPAFWLTASHAPAKYD